VAYRLQESAAPAWLAARSPAWIAALLLLVLGIYWQTTLSMIAVWEHSTTYSHGYLIVPVFLWLVWTRRVGLASLPMRPDWIGLLGLTAMGLLWLVGDFAAAAEPSQFAVVAMVPLAVATVLGRGWVRALAFPFAFLFFAVPFGDSLVPPMMDRTADFVVAALKVSGVPVYREGNFFSTPSGDWSVIEACSGIRYMFACLTVSTLFAWTIYRGTARRLAFIGIALTVAVVANWIRAYAIVMLAQLSNNQTALGVDHLIYGGLFFAAIMAILFAFGALWREDTSGLAGVGASIPDRRKGPVPASPAFGRCLGAALAVTVSLVVWPLLSIGLGGDPATASTPIGTIAPRAGWVRVDEPVASWKPQLEGPSQETLQTFAKSGRRVSLYIGIFDRPSAAAKLTSATNRLVGSQDPQWKQVDRGVAEVRRGREGFSARTGTLTGQGVRIAAWQWYWVDGTATSSPSRAALLQVAARIRGRSQMSAWVTVYTAEDVEAAPPAAPVLDGFVSDMLNAIDDRLQMMAASNTGRNP
jgi:exosortase A